MPTHSLVRRRSLAANALRRLCATAICVSAASASAATIDLADQPLFSGTNVPGNLILDLSVEYPTANSAAYFSTTPYAPSSTFVGYFDSEKCYQYVYNSAAPSSSYFTPYSIASGHVCTSSSVLPLWSGNFLNYASMGAIDIFRWVLTGGNRSVDTLTTTILQKSYHSGQGSGGDFPNKALSSSYEAGATPFTYGGGLNMRIWGGGIRMWISGTGALGNSAASTSAAAVDWNGQNSYQSGTGAANAATIYTLYMNVKVCDTTVGVESNCTRYGSNNKPEGLMQQYANQLRFAAFGYINDTTAKRDAPVLRERMKFVGPTQPVPGSAAIGNGTAEWDASTGIMATNPNPADAAQSSTDTANAGYAVTIGQSGVMNYLDKFGYSAQTYKTYDDVSELYYAAIRYLKAQGNVPIYSSLTGAGSAATMAQWMDGFPIIQSWDDPIVYACQKNFILGIGDVNTWNDADLPGSSLYASSPNEPSPQPAQISGDTTVNVTTATNMVGQMEGLSNLGSTWRVANEYTTYYIAGLAYDSHTKDIRPDLSGTQTVNTYWLDVQEYQTYVTNNQFYLATKYGGFTVPQGFSPYASGNGALTLSSWHTNTDTLGSGSSAQPRPDNYFSAGSAAAMRSGLQSAFAKIASENQTANGTAFATPTPNVTSTGSISYASDYDPQTWTGQLLASSVSYDSSGTPTLGQLWDARALLSASSVTAGTRKIVTCCISRPSSPGLPFTNTSLTTSSLIGRTNYATFSSVPGVAPGSQSVANYIAYLRGDTSQEVANGGPYRSRAYRLGDIVDAKPVAVGAPQAPYYDLYNPGYAAFKAGYSARKTVVYVGANDGMLHAFDGTASGSTAGQELFGYIPSFLYGTASSAPTTGLASLGNPNFIHHYFVDATPEYGDVDFDRSGGSTTATASDWHTLLVGGLGKGGAGYYALDVTDPTTWTSESNVAGKVLWEFTDANMGYSYGKPLIVKTAKYGWVVIVTSGYNNASGAGYFFFINPQTGALLESVAVPGGSSSSPVNLGPASSYVANYADETADAVYAGDLQGNLWRIDVTSASGSYPTPTNFAQLTDPSGSPQPITTRPLIEVDPASNKRYVLVGTGRLLADSDISSAQTQTLYAIADGTGAAGGIYTSATLPSGASFPVKRSQLNANTNLLAGIGSNPTSSMGWYFDMPVTNSIGQRVDVDPTANNGVVAWVANQPNGQACSPGGSGSIYAVSYATGKSVLYDNSGNLVAYSTPGTGVLTDVAILSVAGSLRLYTGDSSGDVIKAPANLTTSTGVKQLNWRGVPLVQ